MHGLLQSRRLTRFRHAHHGAEPVTCGVVGRQRRLGHQNHRDMLQPLTGFHDGAKIVPRNFAAFGFGDNHIRSFVFEDVESLLRGGNEQDVVAVLR